MTARGVVQSPVLVGRDEFLALARNRLAQAADGAGQLLFVAGEAGIGKSRLLGAIAREARADDFAVARAAAFPDDVQSLAGLLLDLASDLSGGTRSSATPCTPTRTCRGGAACTSGWPRPRPSAATGMRSCPRTSSTPAATVSPTGTP